MGLTPIIPENSAKASAPEPLISDGARTLWLRALAWVLALAWIGLSSPISPPVHGTSRTHEALTTDNHALHAFLGRYKKTPTDLRQLSAFAQSESLKFEVYDAFGQRFEYLRLDDDHYMLRSFGDLGHEEDTSGVHGIGVVHWGPQPESLTYRYAKDVVPELYPAVLLAGVDSPDKQWHARLFIDQVKQTRQLIVRNRVRSGAFMVGRHDVVEEFLWLPSGHQIVYTATDSQRTRDGIFLWDLNDDSLRNLLDLLPASLPIAPSQGGNKLYLTLAGISVNQQSATLLAYKMPRTDTPLDPLTFYASKNLIGFVIEQNTKDPPKVVPSTLLGQKKPLDPAASAASLGARIAGAKGLRGQQAWFSLPLSGSMETVLLAWQNYSERASQSPIYPYGLWMLASLYGDSGTLLAAQGNPDAPTLQRYGGEIAKALLNYTLAPSYLKGLALATYDRLNKGQPLTFHVAQLAPPAAETPPVEQPAEHPAPGKK